MSSFSSTLFIALQCSQCSTMQVKQKKKSNNKWSCAVCNQNQSVRKIFAQGDKAKDLRIFVQNFNMSRKSLDDDQQWLLAGTLNPMPEHADDISQSFNDQKKKRVDWTAYLDQDDSTEGGEQEPHGNGFEPLVVTELPNGMFKKRRLVDNSTAGSDRHFDKQLFLNSQGNGFEPLVVTELPNGMFKKRRLVDNSTAGSDRHFDKQLFLNSQDAAEPIIEQQRTTLLTKSISERNKNVTPNNQMTRKCKQTINRAASKWNGYLAEDSDNLELGWKRGFNFKDSSDSLNNSILEAITSEQRVEDDIHPDFL